MLLHKIATGLSLFFSIIYVFLLIPQIYGQIGIETSDSVVAISFVIAISTLITGLLTRIPVVLAPGVSLASYAVFTLALERGIPWETILAAIFLEGIIFFALSVSKLRRWFSLGIPNSFKYGILVGVGLYLAFFGFKNSYILDLSSFPYVDLTNATTLISLIALSIGFALVSKKIPGAFFMTILAGFLLSIAFGLVEAPEKFVDIPSFSFPKLDFEGLAKAGMLSIVLTLFMVDFFDGLGASTSLLLKRGDLDKKGAIKNLDKLMVSDSLTTIISSVFGATTSVVMIESGIALEEKVKSIIPAFVVALLSLSMVFFYPLISSFPLFVVSPVMIILGFLYFSSINIEKFGDIEDIFPALVVSVVTPLTMSISTGIGLGSISYVIIKLRTGKIKDINSAMLAISILFSLDYLYIF